MLVKDSGMEILSRLKQNWKVVAAMLVREFGMEILSNPVQPANAEGPMVLIVLGIVTLRTKHALNAS